MNQTSTLNYQKCFFINSSTGFSVDFIRKEIYKFDLSELQVLVTKSFDHCIQDCDYSESSQKIVLLTEGTNQEVYLFDVNLEILDVVPVRERQLYKVGFLGRSDKIIGLTKYGGVIFDINQTLDESSKQSLLDSFN